MRRPEPVLKSGGSRTSHRKRGRKAGRIDLRGGGRENQIASGKGKFGHVRLEKSRIGAEIFPRRELHSG